MSDRPADLANKVRPRIVYDNDACHFEAVFDDESVAALGELVRRVDAAEARLAACDGLIRDVELWADETYDQEIAERMNDRLRSIRGEL